MSGSKLKAGILYFPGTNCETDLTSALNTTYGIKTDLLWHTQSFNVEHDIYFIPGGFSYGDYLRSGALAARSVSIKSLKEAAQKKIMIVGICNGFQILTESGLLPGALIRNENLKHICRWVNLQPSGDFSKVIDQSFQLPISHSEGNFIASKDELQKIEDEERVILRYMENVNGSMGKIAGIINESRRIIGMMPHPERALHRTKDYSYTEKLPGKYFFDYLFKNDMKATVVGIFGAFYQVRLEDESGQIILAKIFGKLRLKDKERSYFEPKERHPLTIGDVVEIQKDNKQNDREVYLNVYARKNCLRRATVYQKQTLGANLDGVIIISSLDFPSFNEGLMARILVETTLSKIKPILILNKMDLWNGKNNLENQNMNRPVSVMNYLKEIGLCVFFEVLQKGVSPELKNEIQTGRFIAFGESGVGKSTFINQMLGRNVQNTDNQDIIVKGRHITTNPVLQSAGKNFELIDVPGVREFGLMHRSPAEISMGFKEFSKYHCYYANCLHLDEPNCGVKEALENKEFPGFRYEQYCNIMDSMSEIKKPRRGDFRNKS